MNDERVREICVDRLALWTEDLVGDHATPAVLVGIGHDHRSGSISICTNQEVDRDRLIVLLASALDELLNVR